MESLTQDRHAGETVNRTRLTAVLLEQLKDDACGDVRHESAKGTTAAPLGNRRTAFRKDLVRLVEGMEDAVYRGRVLRFDEARGYGFITPDGGGEDVFVHANDLGPDKWQIGPGSIVEFEVQEGERGLKASQVRLVKPPVADPTRASSSSVPSRTASHDEDEDALCDVLAPAEFLHEVTEALIEAVPTLTGEQIVASRRQLMEIARKHGWLEN